MCATCCVRREMDSWCLLMHSEVEKCIASYFQKIINFSSMSMAVRMYVLCGRRSRNPSPKFMTTETSFGGFKANIGAFAR